jgi:hypothetical protein
MNNNPRIIIDTNKHGIRREISLDALWNKSQKRKAYEANKPNRKKKKHVSHETKSKDI